MTAMIFYENAVPLNREQHQGLRVKAGSNDYGFAARTNSLLLAGTEIVEAARDYPVVFIGSEGQFTLAALVGLAGQRNLFVNAEGHWTPHAYLPAFVRRYPFVLAQATSADESLTVCVDESSPLLSREEGEPLFDEEGRETAALANVLEFLRLFHAEMTRTREFANRLHELGLLEQKVITVDRKGEKQQLEGMWVVDEARLLQLPDETVLSLFRSGFLGWVHAHLLSLGNVTRLARRLDELERAGA